MSTNIEERARLEDIVEDSPVLNAVHGTMSANKSSCVKERLGLLQVGRVKALGEPAVDLHQQLLGRGALPLTLPQPREAQRGAELQRLGLLATGHVQSLTKTA